MCNRCAAKQQQADVPFDRKGAGIVEEGWGCELLLE